MVAVVRGDQAIPLDPGLTMADIAAGTSRTRPRSSDRAIPITATTLGPAVPCPGAIYTVGANYRMPGERREGHSDRPLIYGKAASSVGGPGATLGWDRALTSNVDAECELGVVIGRPARNVTAEAAIDHVFGYTIVNDISSRDPWLDGDQWLVGKSMPGFCPVGPWIVTPDELDPTDVRLGCTIDGEPIQDGRTSDMRFSIGEIIAFLSRHLELRPGDLIATGTPARLDSPPGPDRRLQPGDVVECWIEGIGELATTIA
jgi:2-keto-4-pentenoate hydratase/2-oxohepta-3-ene-1,7-dioic acid hydratase in catechol pathway